MLWGGINSFSVYTFKFPLLRVYQVINKKKSICNLLKFAVFNHITQPTIYHVCQLFEAASSRCRNNRAREKGLDACIDAFSFALLFHDRVTKINLVTMCSKKQTNSTEHRNNFIYWSLVLVIATFKWTNSFLVILLEASSDVTRWIKVFFNV